MPILAYCSAKLFGLQDDLLLGVIMVGCVPGAMASNVLTLSARGNVSYSVSLTTLATMLSPIFVPLVLFLILKQSDVDALAIAKQAFFILLIQVVGPVLSGFFLARVWSQLERFMRRWGPIIANLTILWIIAVVVNSNHENLKKLVDPISVGAILVIALLIINLSGFLAGWCGGRVLRLPDGMRRALTLEIGMQNAGLGVILAGKLFADRDMVQLAPALYTFGCMLTGTILAQIWARYSPDEATDMVPNENGDVPPNKAEEGRQ
jgi:BASS family bile acid:Na+ symporter